MGLFNKKAAGTPVRTLVSRPDRRVFGADSTGWWCYANACVQYTVRHSERRVGTDLLAEQGDKWLGEGEWGPAARCLGLAIEQIQSAALGGPYRAPDEMTDEPILTSYRRAMLMSLAEHHDFADGLRADVEHKANLLESIADSGCGTMYRTAAKELRQLFVG